MKLTKEQEDKLREVIDLEIRKGIAKFLNWTDEPDKPIDDPVIVDFADPITESTWDSLLSWLIENNILEEK